MNIKAIRLVRLLIEVTISTLFAVVSGAQPANFPRLHHHDQQQQRRCTRLHLPAGH